MKQVTTQPGTCQRPVPLFPPDKDGVTAVCGRPLPCPIHGNDDEHETPEEDD